MYSNSNRIRNIEIPENLFSNLGELKSKKITNEIPQIEKTFQPDMDIKLTNYSKKNEYRNRISKMYENIKDITPIDNEIDDVIYFNNYTERGIVVKPKVSALKQFWTEYRLINNEKLAYKETPTKIERKLDEFNELFEALSVRVTEINKYIDELKEMRTTIDTSNNQLKQDREQLSKERENFLNFRKKEEEKIKEEKETLKINFERLQTIIDDLDKKLESIDK